MCSGAFRERLDNLSPYFNFFGLSLFFSFVSGPLNFLALVVRRTWLEIPRICFHRTAHSRSPTRQNDTEPCSRGQGRGWKPTGASETAFSSDPEI